MIPVYVSVDPYIFALQQLLAALIAVGVGGHLWVDASVLSAR